MLRTICKQFLRPAATLNLSIPKYQCPDQWRLFCSNTTESDYGGLSVSDTKVLKYLNNAKTEYDVLVKRKESLGRDGHEKINELQKMVEIFNCRNSAIENLNILNEELAREKDSDMLTLMNDEKKEFLASIISLNSQLMESIFDVPEEHYCSSLFLEVSAGVGGQEAMLFASEIYDMYVQYCKYKRWNVETISVDQSEIGGLRHSSCIVNSSEAFNLLRFEAGVHRVQRIPSTEKTGRIHTSTVTVAVIPKPDEIDLKINDRDLKIETKRASGAGGQHVNTTDSAVRIVHIPTGLAVECQTERSQIKNKEIALIKLQAKLCKQHFDAENASTQATRKSQVGSSLRNEKIRTYNFNQDRVTDHRIDSGTLHNLQSFLAGGPPLDELLNRLRLSNRRKEIVELIERTE